MDKKKMIRWSFWPILATILIIVYFMASAPPKNQHLDLIPSEANAVVILDSKKLMKNYYQLLRYNPLLVDKVLPEGDGDFEMPSELPGINPLDKVALYVYKDEGSRNEQYFKCMLLSVNDKAAFIKTMNGYKEKADKKVVSGIDIIHFKKENRVLLVNESNGFVIEPVDPSFEMDLTIGERHFEKVFGEKAGHLKDSSASFATTLMRDKQMNIWMGSGEGVLKGMGGDRLSINKIFNSQSISINLEPKGIETHAHLYLNDTAFIRDIEAGSSELQENELLKTCMSLNPDKFDQFFEELLPEDQQELAASWTGKVCASIVGFRNKPVYQIRSTNIINELTHDTTYFTDTVELSEKVNLPHFITSVEIADPEQALTYLNKDTSLSKEGRFYQLAIPKLIDEYVYVTIEENNLIMASLPYSFEYTPEFKTFAFSVNIEEMLTSYPPKDMIQAIVIPSMNKFEFKSFEMHYDGMEDDHLVLHGQLKMGDENTHTMLQMIPFVYHMVIDF